MVGASFGGTLNADSLQVGGSLLMRSNDKNKASFKDVNLLGANIKGQIDMDGASFGGTLNANSLQVGDSLLMRSGGQNKASFNDVDLRSANVKGQISMVGASFGGTLTADSLQVGGSLLMGSDDKNKASFNNVILLGANIKGQVAMTGASFSGTLDAQALQVGRDLLMYSGSQNKASFNDVDLRGAKIKGDVYMVGASFGGTLNADSLQVGGSLLMGSDDKNKASFNNVILLGANVKGQISMVGASFGGTLTADSLQVGGSLLMGSDDKNKASFNSVDLRGANIKGQVAMVGASFGGALNADALQVGGSLLMGSDDKNKASFKDVDLRGANIMGQVDMTDASFGGTLIANALQAGESLFMRSNGESKASFKDVILRGANIKGQVNMTGASFGGKLYAEALQVGSDLFLQNVYCIKETVMTFAHIGGNLDLRGATLPGLDLSGVSVAADLDLGGPESTVWTGQDGEPRALNLRNTHIGNLADAKYAWPVQGQLHLDGFTFGHLGGFAGDTEPEMRDRGMEWWDDWASRDIKYSPTPYAQLAAALTNAGDRDAANEIRYLSRVRERETEKRFCYIWSGALQYVAGFGIGTYTFRVLWWVLGFSLLGALYLRTRVQGVRDENHGSIWCFGASLSRLLPVIEINEDFKGFFEDSKSRKIIQLAEFSVFRYGHRGVGTDRRRFGPDPKLVIGTCDSTVTASPGSELVSCQLVCSVPMLRMTAIWRTGVHSGDGRSKPSPA